jgi:hypothetical protein
MFRAFRAILGVLIAYAAYAPHDLAIRFETLGLLRIKTQLETAQPGEKLSAMAQAGLHRLKTE